MKYYMFYGEVMKSNIAVVAITLLLGTSSVALAEPPSAPPPENMGTGQQAAAIEGLTGAPPPDGKVCDLATIAAWKLAGSVPTSPGNTGVAGACAQAVAQITGIGN